MKLLHLAILAVLLLAHGMAHSQQAPQRIVSINSCLDPVLTELVPHERLTALSQYSRDPWRSTITQIAQTLPSSGESAEEVIALKPDVVIASRHTAIHTRLALERVGVRVALFEVPKSIQASFKQIRELAELVQRQQQGEALIARIEHAIEQARPAPGYRHLTAVIYQPGGLSAGRNSVTDELMSAVGFVNVAARHQLVGYRPLPLEMLISDPPDVLLAGDTTAAAATQAEHLVHHRALRALESRMSREPFPARLFNCAGPTMILALDALVAARKRATEALKERALQTAAAQ